MIKLADFKAKLKNEGTVDWSQSVTFETLWCFKMKASRLEIWKYLSDTSRFNREMGFGNRTQTEKDGKLFVKTKMLGSTQEWIEEPWTWLSGRTISSHRNYLSGMAKSVHSVFHIESLEASDERLVYLYFGWNPANHFWKFFLKSTSPILQSNFAKAFAKLDRHFQSSSAHNQKAFQAVPPPLSEAVASKLSAFRQQLQGKKLSPKAIDALVDLVVTGDDFDLEPMKLIPLARQLEIDQSQFLAAALHATRLGMLKMSWDLICPHCRGSKYTAESLGAIPELSACEVCDIEFSSSDVNAVEVMFHIHPSLRKIDPPMFCAAEPAKKNHIEVQQVLKPGTKLQLRLQLNVGSYRARLAGQDGEATIEVNQAYLESEINLDGFHGQHFKAGSSFTLTFENTRNENYLFVLENLLWESSALKPAHVFALPEFRDLFSEEHLNSNVKLYLGEQTILFTDIVGSTNFYNNVGDAKAFSEIRIHFQELFSIIQSHHGVIVKTIGDAVMASFLSPEEALSSAIKIQQLYSEDRKDISIRLRISVHCGPVIAVHLHTGIDYFGNTVNYAAKIQAVARAGEIALSKEVFEFYKINFSTHFETDIRQNKRDGGVPGDIFILKITNEKLSAKTPLSA